MPALSAMSRTVVARRPRSANIVAARSNNSSRRLFAWPATRSTGSGYQPSACLATGSLRVLARYRDDLAGQVAGVVAGEEGDGGRHLPRFGGAPEGFAGRQPVEQ